MVQLAWCFPSVQGRLQRCADGVDALVTLIKADVAAGTAADLDADAVVSLLMGSCLGELLRRGVADDDGLS